MDTVNKSLRQIKITVGGTPVGKGYTWSYPNYNQKIYIIPTYEMILEGTNDFNQREQFRFEVYRFGVTLKAGRSAPQVVGLADHQSHTIKQFIPTYRVHSAPSQEDGAWQVYDNFLIHDGPDAPDNRSESPYATVGCIEVCGPGMFRTFNERLIRLSGVRKDLLKTTQLLNIGKSGKMRITYLPATRPPLKEA